MLRVWFTNPKPVYCIADGKRSASGSRLFCLVFLTNCRAVNVVECYAMRIWPEATSYTDEDLTLSNLESLPVVNRKAVLYGQTVDGVD